MQQSKDPYKDNLLLDDIYLHKTDIVGTIKVVLNGMLENRGMLLMSAPSRALCKYEIHELILTDYIDEAQQKVVDRISYLGFVEIEEGGVVLVGDEVYLDNSYIGTIHGFDETHFPNHLNIIIKCEQRYLSTNFNTALGQKLTIKGR